MEYCFDPEAQGCTSSLGGRGTKQKLPVEFYHSVGRMFNANFQSTAGAVLHSSTYNVGRRLNALGKGIYLGSLRDRVTVYRVTVL